MRLREVFASNLRRLRIERRLSQEALADGAGVDRTYIGSLERQVYSPTIDMVEKLAEVLDVPPHKFLVDDMSQA